METSIRLQSRETVNCYGCAPWASTWTICVCDIGNWQRLKQCTHPRCSSSDDSPRPVQIVEYLRNSARAPYQHEFWTRGAFNFYIIDLFMKRWLAIEFRACTVVGIVMPLSRQHLHLGLCSRQCGMQLCGTQIYSRSHKEQNLSNQFVQKGKGKTADASASWQILEFYPKMSKRVTG